MPSKIPMQEFVIDLLKTSTPDTYYYHNYHHSLYVQEKAAEIGAYENCSKKELDLLYAAALWHDTGYIHKHKDHERESCVLARQYLPGYGYTDADIHKICGMIMATKISRTPRTKLEKIIADADTEYLGTEKAATWANDLFKELSILNPLLTKELWNKIEINFLTKHVFFTSFCIENREPIKQSYLNSLRNGK